MCAEEARIIALSTRPDDYGWAARRLAACLARPVLRSLSGASRGAAPSATPNRTAVRRTFVATFYGVPVKQP